MNGFFEDPVSRSDTPQAELLLGTIGSVTSAGATLILDGASTPTTKRYKHVVTGTTLAANDRVLLAKLSGTYVILGKIAF